VATYEDYRRAAALLWGPAGDFAAAEVERLNREHFAGAAPPLPVIVSLTAWGRCIGLTRGGWLEAPRITLSPEVFNGNARSPGGSLMVSDVLLHELVHAVLLLRGEDAGHNGAPWAAMLTELSPAVLGREVTAAPVLPRRVPNPARATDPSAPKTRVVRVTEPGALTRKQLADWPRALRPDGYYADGAPLTVPTY
jgi:hypothetical protein